MRFAPLLLPLLLAGCVPPELAVVDSLDLGATPAGPLVQARDGGFSAGWNDRSVWLFGDTVLSAPAADGVTWRDSHASWTDQLSVDPATGLLGLTETVDAAGAPRELFPRTAAEIAADTPESRIAIWPGPLVPDPRRDRALAFWWSVLSEPAGFTGRGMGVAVWTDPDGSPDRPVIDAGASDPTLLFGGDTLTPANAAALDGNWLYAFACPGAEARCRLGRVHADDVLVPSAWQWYRGLGDWSYDPAHGAALFEGAERMSLHRSPALQRWVLVYSRPQSNVIVARTADAPEGPWSDEVELVRTVAPVGTAFTSSGLAHPELADGPVEYLSYVRPTGTWTSEVRLVRIEWEMATAE